MRWGRTTIQKDNEISNLVSEYLNTKERQCALICGAGFDPRTLHLSGILPQELRDRIFTLCLREERPKPQPTLRAIANGNAAALQTSFKQCSIAEIQIFDGDTGVVGGRNVLATLQGFLEAADSQRRLTDILVDISALSCGIFFPIFAQLLARISADSLPWNVHLFVTEDPLIDFHIHGEITDSVSHIHGFRSKDSLIQTGDHAGLWVPVLSENNEAQMRLIHGMITQPASTIDICPIVPFPGTNPRKPDLLVEHYKDLIGEWEIDPRHLLYAAESDPLDSYRSICEIDDLRHKTYHDLGGSSTIVSPLGSKMLSVGLMLAAIERDLRAVYVECRGYDEKSVPYSVQPAPNYALRHLCLQW